MNKDTNKPFDQNIKITTRPSSAADEAAMRARNADHRKAVDEARKQDRRAKRVTAWAAGLITPTAIAVGLAAGPRSASESEVPRDNAPAAVAAEHPSTTVGPNFDLDDREAAEAWSRQAGRENQEANEHDEVQRMITGGIDPSAGPQG